MKSPGMSLVIGVASLLIAGVLPINAAEHAFVGSKKCKPCHVKEWKSWSETKMAKAFDVLRPGALAKEKQAAKLDPAKDYTTDKGCLACHVTGFGKRGGFVDFKTTPDLVGVGCEMCHGAGGTYISKGHMTLENKEFKRADLVKVGLVGTIAEEQCKVCHNDKSPFVGAGYVFDFAKRKAQGTHEKFPLKYKH